MTDQEWAFGNMALKFTSLTLHSCRLFFIDLNDIIKWLFFLEKCCLFNSNQLTLVHHGNIRTMWCTTNPSFIKLLSWSGLVVLF